jgi:hypothetical protein
MPRHAAACHGAQLPQRAHGADRPAESRTACNSSCHPAGRGGECGRAHSVEPWHLVWCLAKTTSVINPINRRATTVVLARRTYPDNPANLIPSSWRPGPMTTLVATLARARMCAYIFSTEFAKWRGQWVRPCVKLVFSFLHVQQLNRRETIIYSK